MCFVFQTTVQRQPRKMAGNSACRLQQPPLDHHLQSSYRTGEDHGGRGTGTEFEGSPLACRLKRLRATSKRRTSQLLRNTSRTSTGSMWPNVWPSAQISREANRPDGQHSEKVTCTFKVRVQVLVGLERASSKKVTEDKEWPWGILFS